MPCFNVSSSAVLRSAAYLSLSAMNFNLAIATTVLHLMISIGWNKQVSLDN